MRLDTELVRRGLARSREQAAELIAAGRVAVGGQAVAKAATQVGPGRGDHVADPASGPDYASRGGRKLEGALAAFADLAVAGRRCLDAGRFDRRLHRCAAPGRGGARAAVDVGYGQLAWSLRSDPRVTVLDRVNVRQLTPEQVAPGPGLVTADLSFISLTLVLPALAACAAPDADFVLLVKPQFEVGKGNVGAGGVVSDPALRGPRPSVGGRRRAAGLGLGVAGIVAARFPARPGTWSISCGCAARRRRWPRCLAQAIAEGPAVKPERTVLVVAHIGRHAAVRAGPRGRGPAGRRGHRRPGAGG